MYGFVDTIETAKNIGMSIKTNIDGYVLDDELTDDEGSFTTLVVSGRDDMQSRVNFTEMSNMSGLVEEGFQLESKEITIKYEIKDKTNEGFRKRLDKLNELVYKQKVEISFDDEEYYRYVTFSHNEIGEEDSNYLVATLVMTASDPYKYSKDELNKKLQDVSMIENTGNEITYPIIELTAKKKATFAMIHNLSDEYFLLGRPADVDESVVNERELILSEYGNTISTWNQPNKGVDRRGVSVIAGKMGYDGTGIVAESYGTGANWHGPAITKAIPATQDFEVEMMLRGETVRPNQTYRIEFYLLDEAKEVLGKMAIVNRSATSIDFVAEARYGDFINAHTNYPISSKNYMKREKHFHGMLRMKRIGRRFEFYVSRVNTNGHWQSLTKTFNDALGAYQGKLRYIQVHIGKFGTSANPNLPRINSIRIYKHNKVLIDQTPYIVDKDDIIVIDNDKGAVTVNGENAMHIKDFGSSFMGLHSGHNQLTISPENTFDGRIKYKEKLK